MTQATLDFIKRADKFVIIMDDVKTEYTNYADAARFYNSHVFSAGKIELTAICGMVGLTIAYRYNNL